MPVNVVINALCGKYAQNSQIAALAALSGTPFAGGSVKNQGVAFDKYITKLLAAALRVKQPDYVVIDRTSPKKPAALMKAAARKIGFPCVVKPAEGFCGVAVSKVEVEGELEEAITQAMRVSDKVLVEKFIEHDLGAFCARVEGKETISFFEGISGEIEEIANEEIADEEKEALLNKVKAVSAKLFDVFSGRGVVELEFLIDKNGEIYFIECNAAPFVRFSGQTGSLWGMGKEAFAEYLEKLIDAAE
jgi:D-alanine-D-alanine ligase